MNAERLLAHYETIADAPDAITRLRRFILDLAVRGKLVPQDASDEPASELLTRIAMEKERLVKAGEIRKPKLLPPVDEPPFELPQNWHWTRIREVASDRGQEIPRATFTYIDVTAIDKEAGIVADAKVLEASEAPSRARKVTQKGDVIYSCVRPYLLNVAVVETDFDPKPIASTAFAILNGHGLVMPRYIWIVLRSPFMVECVEGSQRGQAYPAINDADFALLPFPLPPLAEQHRVVTKVDELMDLCDRLEAARAGREELRDRLAAANLARLNGLDPVTFQADARFVLNALPALTARPDQIKALRQTIFNLAVRGKLVPQDPKDRGSPLPPLRLFAAASGMDDDVFEQFEGSVVLPSKWQIAPLAQLSENIVDCPHTTPKWTKSGEICIRTNQLRPRILDLSEPRYVSSEAYFERIERLEPKADDILYSREGGILGIACRVPPNIRLCLGQRLMLIRAGTTIRADFLEIVLNSPFITDIAKARTTGGAAPRVNMSTVRAYPIPLPPLAEQHRIVAKVDALMALCDQLEASLTATDATRSRLLDTLLAEALAPSDEHGIPAVIERVSETALFRPSTTLDAEKERSALILTLAYERHRSARRDWSFGHVKAQKILHFVEAEAGYDLGRSPIRDAAGPNDFQHLLGVEKWALEHRRFAFEKNGSGYIFKPLADFQKSLALASDIDSATRARIERIIDLFTPMDMGSAEVFATVYAAWNNLLIEGQTPSDDDIIRGARENWHPQKLKIPREKFAAALRHLRSSEFVPSGRGKFVHSSQQQDLFRAR